MANRNDFDRLEKGGKAGLLLEDLQQERHLGKGFLR